MSRGTWRRGLHRHPPVEEVDEDLPPDAFVGRAPNGRVQHGHAGLVHGIEQLRRQPALQVDEAGLAPLPLLALALRLVGTAVLPGG